MIWIEKSEQDWLWNHGRCCNGNRVFEMQFSRTSSSCLSIETQVRIPNQMRKNNIDNHVDVPLNGPREIMSSQLTIAHMRQKVTDAQQNRIRNAPPCNAEEKEEEEEQKKQSKNSSCQYSNKDKWFGTKSHQFQSPSKDCFCSLGTSSASNFQPSLPPSLRPREWNPKFVKSYRNSASVSSFFFLVASFWISPHQSNRTSAVSLVVSADTDASTSILTRSPPVKMNADVVIPDEAWFLQTPQISQTFKNTHPTRAKNAANSFRPTTAAAHGAPATAMAFATPKIPLLRFAFGSSK